MKQVTNILVAIDMSSVGDEALARAISVAKKKDAQLSVIHVIEPLFLESPYSVSADEEMIKRLMKDKVDKLNEKAKIKYLLFIEYGTVKDAVTLKVKQLKSDLLVIGSCGKDDLESSYFGSNSLKLIQNTHIPVLIVKNRVKDIYQKIIAPTNMSDYSKECILFANTLFTKPSKTYLYAQKTISKPQSMTYHISEEQRQDMIKEMNIKAEMALSTFAKEVGEGKTARIDYRASVDEDLLDYIIKDNADLLVLGSKGVNDLNSFVFGSTASYLLQRSPIDVLVYVPS